MQEFRALRTASEKMKGVQAAAAVVAVLLLKIINACVGQTGISEKLSEIKGGCSVFRGHSLWAIQATRVTAANRCIILANKRSCAKEINLVSFIGRHILHRPTYVKRGADQQEE